MTVILGQKKYKELYRKLMQIMAETEEGSIRFYSVCENCEGKIRTIGQIAEHIEQAAEEVIVI